MKYENFCLLGITILLFSLHIWSYDQQNYPWNLECFVEDLFLGGQWSIILGYRRLSVKSLLVLRTQETRAMTHRPCAWRLLLCVTLSKQRECWKLRDWRLSSEFDSRVHGQPSIHGSFIISFQITRRLSGNGPKVAKFLDR